MTVSPQEPTKVIRLSPVLDLGAAGPLAAEMQASRGMELTVDASEVQRIGSQCVQVILSAQATWAADKADFRVVSPSQEFIKGTALLGADRLVPESSMPELLS